MDTIIYVLLALVVGALASYFFFRGQAKPEPSAQEAQVPASPEVDPELSRLLQEAQTKLKASEQTAEQLRSELARQSAFESEASRLTAEVGTLTTELESVKSKLANAERFSEELKRQTLVSSMSEGATGASTAEVGVLTAELNATKLLLAEAEQASEGLRQQVEELTPLKEAHAKLSKQVKDLEEDKEDLEDALKKAERKSEELDAEVQELSPLREEVAELKGKVDILGDSLKQKEQENANKAQALGFVRDILKAPSIAGKENHDEVLQAIDQVGTFVRDDFQAFLKSLDLSAEKYLEQLPRWMANKRKTWIDGKRSIAFVGEFSAGKTSIVNRLIPDKPLPVSSKATTAIPTYISAGKKNSYHFVSPDDTEHSITEHVFSNVKKEVLDEVDGVSSLIKYFVMAYDNKNLEGLSILDTPGFNSNDPEDARRTIEVINESDALFWVFDVNTGTINRASLKLIKEHLRKPLYIIINKVDAKSPGEVDNVEALISKTLKNEGVKYEQIIRFSQKENVSVLLSAIQGIAINQGTSAYLKDVGSRIKSIKSQKEEYLKGLKKERNEADANIDAIIDNLNQYLGELSDQAEALLSIPQFTEKWFSKDRYEFSVEQWEEFSQRLNFLAIELRNNLVEHIGWLKDWTEHMATLDGKISAETEVKQQAQKLDSDFYKLYKVLTPTKQSDK